MAATKVIAETARLESRVLAHSCHAGGIMFAFVDSGFYNLFV